MTSPLVTKIAGILATALPSAGITEAATLIRVTAGSRGATVSAGTNPTSTSYTCKGFVSTDKHTKIADTLVDVQDRVVSLLGSGLAVIPVTTDKITIDGTTLRIIAIEGNAAIWTCLCRV